MKKKKITEKIITQKLAINYSSKSPLKG